ncbi:hypothetical protein [Kamptonema sp. UHCC 0994]|uniref:hypothetical protein n=1 Tax=Kamptonema sp. UHCC 0994 TaxID=3031329 RepID=UPI0023BABD00|nr:hypothetical protein [Kamptonema sp. UHCC 0994]MDF0556426.1 hypothetical protein [Kamptonema sp. UHCC 0994]
MFKLRFKPKHYVFIAIAGILLGMAGATAYDVYRKREGWCVRARPDGNLYTRYGRECELPSSP